MSEQALKIMFLLPLCIPLVFIASILIGGALLSCVSYVFKEDMDSRWKKIDDALIIIFYKELKAETKWGDATCSLRWLNEWTKKKYLIPVIGGFGSMFVLTIFTYVALLLGLFAPTVGIVIASTFGTLFILRQMVEFGRNTMSEHVAKLHKGK